MRLAAGIAGLVLGIALGLAAGLYVWPVEYQDVTPEYMSEEYRVDYARMIASAFAADGNDELALARLGRLGTQAEVAVLNAFLVAREDPAALDALQQLAAMLQLHATMPTPAE